MVEVVMDGCVNRDEFLQTSQAPVLLHRLLASSKWEMGVFTAIVQPAANLLCCFITNYFHRSAVRS